MVIGHQENVDELGDPDVVYEVVIDETGDI